MKHFKLDKTNLLIIIVLVFSVINIFTKIGTESYTSLLTSVIGLVGVVLFFMRKHLFRFCILFWMYIQLIVLHHTVLDPSTNTMVSDPMFDATQVFGRLLINYSVSGSTQSFGIGLNIVVFLYIFLFRYVRSDAFVGRSAVLMFLNTPPGFVVAEGCRGLFRQRINLDGDDQWLLAELSDPIQFNGIRYDRMAVMTERGLLTNVIRLVPEQAVILPGINPMLGFERVDWIQLSW